MSDLIFKQYDELKDYEAEKLPATRAQLPDEYFIITLNSLTKFHKAKSGGIFLILKGSINRDETTKEWVTGIFRIGKTNNPQQNLRSEGDFKLLWKASGIDTKPANIDPVWFRDVFVPELVGKSIKARVYAEKDKETQEFRLYKNQHTYLLVPASVKSVITEATVESPQAAGSFKLKDNF